MTTLTGHFDGRVIVPDGPVKLPKGKLLMHVEPIEFRSTLPPTVNGRQMVELVNHLDWPKDDLEEIRRAIEADCERVDADGW